MTADERLDWIAWNAGIMAGILHAHMDDLSPDAQTTAKEIIQQTHDILRVKAEGKPIVLPERGDGFGRST